MKNLETRHSQNGKIFHPQAELIDGALRFATETRDVAIVEYAQTLSGPSRQCSLERALEVGVRMQMTQQAGDAVIALNDQMSAASKAVSDHLSAAGGHFANQLRILETAYLDEKAGKLPQTISKITREFCQQLDPEKGDALRKLRDVMIADLTKPARQLIDDVRGLLDLNRGDSAVAILNTKVSELALALSAIGAKLDAQTSIGHAKLSNPHFAGVSLEDYFLEVVRPIVQACGEELEDVRDLGGAEGRAKVGDFVIRVDAALSGGENASLVVEIKNRRDSISKLLQELKAARDNRSATAALGVLTNPRASSGPSCEIFGKDKVVVFLPGFPNIACGAELAEQLLRHGYKIARLLAIANAKPHARPELDLARLQDICTELNSISKRFSALAADHTRVRTAVSNAESTAASIKSELMRAVQNLETS